MPLVFQYGSNCDERRFNGRLDDDAVDLGGAETVAGYDIAFDVWSQRNGCAASDLVKRRSGHAWGVLYEISKSGFEKLKRVEGKHYQPKRIRVRSSTGEIVFATTFLVKPCDRQQGLWTSANYVGHIVSGLRDHKVPEDYVQRVIDIAIAANDVAKDVKSSRKENQRIEHAKSQIKRTMNISPRFRVDDWNSLTFTTEEDWQQAINIVEDRIYGRWLRCIDDMINWRHSGFAVLALDCIVLETLWGFVNGRPLPRGKERDAYRSILKGNRFGWNDDLSDRFREFVRNGLMHDAETRNRWLVEKSVPRDSIVEQNPHGDYQINRTKFHQALKATVGDWMNELRLGNDTALRQKMCQRMDQIILKHYAS